MKKRILALALVGTTAFSVFGAAMSANAGVVYNGGSSHVGAYDGAYYQSYTPAGDINWNTQNVAATTALVGKQTWAPVNYKAGTVLSKNDVLYTTQDIYKTMTTQAVKDFVTVLGANDGIYFKNMDAFATANDYSTYTTVADGTFKIGKVTYQIATKGGKTYVFTKTEFDGLTGNQYTAVPGVATYYLNTGLPTSDNNGSKQIFTEDEVLATYAADSKHPYYFIDNGGNGNENTNLKPIAGDTVNIPVTDSYDTEGVYTDAGYTTLDAVDVTDIDAIMNETVYPTGVVYLYDYYYDNSFPVKVSADTFADSWAKGTLATTLKDAGYKATGTIHPETVYSYRSIREEVIYAWQDFLDELGIADASNSGLTMWAKETLANYAYTYQDASIIANVEYVKGQWKITYGGSVNLYNFDDLIEDILEYAPSNAAAGAQTSELIYLMQQYNKFVDDGFVTVNPVENDDWGDLLVALAQAPTEDDFRTTAAYNRYTNKVEDLVEQYEEASTSVAVSMAEEALYDFVTSYNSAYTVSEKADTTALVTAIDNTYFNANWAKIGEVYAGQDPDGVMTTNLSNTDYKSAWALYPLADYSGSMKGSYPGVDTGLTTGVSSEYYWFYNVYDLAYNVYTSNKYQSVVDLVASTLDEAVDALAPSSNAYASTILKAEEQNDKLENLIETDYTAAMWANRNKINSYINDRVSNDEIGSYGSSNAADIAQQTATLLGYQKNQTVVTRTDINDVKTAKASAEAALTALRNDTENYNAAQATALQKAIDECNVVIDLYNGEYGKSASTQSVNGTFTASVGDKDQILKSDITDAVQAVDDAINFSSIIMGWSQDKDGNWMYGTENGYLNDGWHQVDGGKTWFYFNEDGTAKQNEWWQDGNTWYYFNSNCGAAVGWAKVDGNWYYFKGNNAMKTGWEKVDGCWYYMDGSGKMVTGWCQIDGTWYYFSKASNALGQMLANTTTPDGYKVDANGALVD